MYNGLQCLPVKINLVLYALDSAHEQFDIENKVNPLLKFSCGSVELISQVDPN